MKSVQILADVFSLPNIFEGKILSIKMKFKRASGKIHLWLGLVSGLVVFVVSVTGCTYVFEKELKQFFYKERLVIERQNASKKLPVSVLVDRAEALFDHNIKAYSLVVPTSKNETLQVHFYKWLSIDKTGLWTWYGQEQEYYYIAYMNPYNGQLVYLENTKWEFFNVVEAIHKSLLLGPIGNRIIAVNVLIFLILLITGMVLWWPKNRKAFKARTWFRWKSSTKWRRKNYDLHNIPGFYILFFALIISITGLSWSFDWMNQSVQWVANGGKVKPTGYKEVQSNFKNTIVKKPVDKIVAGLFEDYPRALHYHFFYPRDSLGTFWSFVDYGSSTQWSMISHDRYSIQKLDEYSLSDLNNGEVVEWLNYDIHTGRVFGLFGKILVFLVGLTSASLPITGFLIWWGRRRKKYREPTTKKYPELTLVSKAQKSFAENDGVVYMNLKGKHDTPQKS